MKHEYIEFAFDEKLGYARCLMICNGQAFEGGAKCHPDDMDMISERTGCCIAEARAYIKALRFKRDPIVDEKDGWGKLKSGIGWICLKYTKKV